VICFEGNILYVLRSELPGYLSPGATVGVCPL
jgi:hypothetical protein